MTTGGTATGGLTTGSEARSRSADSPPIRARSSPASSSPPCRGARPTAAASSPRPPPRAPSPCWRPPAPSCRPASRCVADDNPRRRLALMAARFFARQPRIIAAVTGTSGKTSIAEFTRQIWQLLGRRAASLGTLGLVAPGGSEYLLPHHARSDRSPSAPRRAGRCRHRSSGDGGLHPRPRPVPPRRGESRGRRLHQSHPRPSRLPRHHGRLSRRQAAALRRGDGVRRHGRAQPDAPEFAQLAAASTASTAIA